MAVKNQFLTFCCVFRKTTLLISRSRANAEPRDDASDYLRNLLLGQVTVAYVAQPEAANLEQLHNIIAQGTFKVPQICGKSHSKLLR
jgi:hypothetical protein